jgi:enoyl-CoA hydratase/carnithine racemase
VTASGSEPLVRLTQHGPVAELALDRPAALNAISTALATELVDACAELGRLVHSAPLRAAVLTSTSERAFCVGADLKERVRFTDADLLAQRPLMRAAFEAVRSVAVPTIAAVNGHALGGGFELALSCDLIVVDEAADLALPETSVGLVPGGGGTQLLVRRAGPGVAADLILSARHVTGPEAVRLGLADRLVPRGEARTAALELARSIAANSPTAVRAARRALRLGADRDLEAALELEDAAWREAATSPDRAEGIAAFVEKRSPRWSSGSG